MQEHSKRFAVLYTGGTIGMVQTQTGLSPASDLAERMGAYGGHGQRIDWHEATPLIDSSALTLADWQRWLSWLQTHLPDYDGVLILHGTDTLAYTANLLAMALAGVGKPIVLTGAQWPFGSPGSDAADNMRMALSALALDELKDVVVAFGGCLWRAVGSSKVSTECAEGFASAHFPPLARWQDAVGFSNIRFHDLPVWDAPACWTLDSSVKVVCHTLTPGANTAMVAHSLRSFDADAVILASYGHGNAPDEADLMDAIAHTRARGVPVLNISQVPQGCAASVYAQGHGLRHAGVINGGKANRETALALMTLAASQRWNEAQIVQQLQHWQLLPR